MEGSSRFQNWFQITSNVAIVIGLGLVIYELNQSKQLVVAQMAQSIADRLVNQRLALLGDDPRQALARAALHPAELNPSDAVALNTYYEVLVLNWTSMHRTGQILGVDRGWQQVVAWDAREHFSTAPGRRWLKAWIAEEPQYPAPAELMEIREIAKEALRDEPANYYQSKYGLLLAKD